VTIRAREAIRLSRAWALEMELATRWVKLASLSSHPGGRISPVSA
jgi:hypothetical protein